MGMYTELVLSTRIKNDPTAVAVLKYMAGATNELPALPDHPLFATTRWRMLFSCSSHYFVPTSVVKFEFNDIANCWLLISRADLKNYENEIEKFVDWINPYLEIENGEMFGYSRHEECLEPTIHFK